MNIMSGFSEVRKFGKAIWEITGKGNKCRFGI